MVNRGQAIGRRKVLRVGGAVVPVVSEGSKDDLRQGRATIQGLRVGLKILDVNHSRDRVPLTGPSTNEGPVKQLPCPFVWQEVLR
jgi:hypothetical protein